MRRGDWFLLAVLILITFATMVGILITMNGREPLQVEWIT